MSQLDAWLRGPVPGVTPHLMPVAHALVQTVEDVQRAVAELSPDQLWARPGAAAAVGFHLRHIAGVVDRLFTYARGEPLNAAQLARLKVESEPGQSPAADALLRDLQTVVDNALAQLRLTPPETLLDRRDVGRQRIPSTVLGLLFHAAEHAQRHTGQAIATARIIGRSTERVIPVLPGDDLELTRDFYVNKLGFAVLWEFQDGETGMIGLQRDSLELTIDCPMTGHGRNVCVSLRVNDTDAYFEEWRGRIDIGRPPQNEEWGARTFGVTDPAGNTLFVIGPVPDGS